MSKNRVIFATCAFTLALCGHVAIASESQGSIQNGFNLTKICKSIDCSSYGNVNWKPTLNANTTGATVVTITDSSITGYLWGDEIGWVNLQPTGYGVTVNPNTGALSGYAYANVGSWINFSPTTVSGGMSVGVSINAQGQFSGWAYVSGIDGGWMEFDCSSAATCITTDWRPIPSRTVSSNPSNSSTGSGSSFSSGGSTPERRSADLAAIWAYNTIQTTPTSTPNLIIKNKYIPNMQSDDQMKNGTAPENTNINGNVTNQRSSSTTISTGSDSNPQISFWLNIVQSPVTKIIGVIVLLGLLLLLIRILM
jgi:hypothetical protein